MGLKDYIFMAVTTGFRDSMNPYVLSGILLFFIFLSRVGRTPKHVLVSGFFATASFFIATFFFVKGAFDYWLDFRGVFYGTLALSFSVAVMFVLLGFRIFRDWYRNKKASGEGAVIAHLPAFLKERDNEFSSGTATGRKGERIVGIIFLSVILGVLGMLMGTLWPPTQRFYAFYVTCYSIAASGNTGIGVLLFILYSLGFVFSLVVVWLLVLCMRCSKTLRLFIVNTISLAQVVISSIFLSTGIGMMHLAIFLLRNGAR